MRPQRSVPDPWRGGQRDGEPIERVLPRPPCVYDERMKRTAFLVSAAGIGLAMLATAGLGACSSEASATAGGGGATASSGSGAGGGSTTCEHAWEPAPAEYADYANGTTSAPPCATSADTLPCGACDAAAARCSVSVHRDCCDAGSTLGPLDAWLCDCTGGAWSCWVLFPAAAACTCNDAGVGGG
jgi:hypothetical protein